MTTTKVKNDLHRLIIETDDEAILLQVINLFRTLRAEKTHIDWYPDPIHHSTRFR